MKVLRILFLLSMLSLSAGCQQGLLKADDDTGKLGDVGLQSSPADTYIQLAAEYYRIGDYATALTKAKQAVRKDPGSANAYLMLGLVYEALNEIDRAQTAYRQARKIDDRNPYVLNAYGRLLCQLEEYEKSLAAFDRAVENPLYDTPWVAFTNAGICALAAGDQRRAESYFLKALQANPRYPMALAQMAQLSYDQGKYLSTRAYIQRFREVAKATARLLYLSILTERKLGDRDQERSDELLLKAEYPDSEEARKLAR